MYWHEPCCVPSDMGKRLGKREREAIRAIKARRARIVAEGCKGIHASRIAMSEQPRLTTAYSVPKAKPERLSLWGHIRVMHNHKGSELREGDKPFKKRWAND